MLSDACFELIQMIESYQAPDHPCRDWYDDMGEEIGAVKGYLDALRKFFDSNGGMSRATLRERLKLPAVPGEEVRRVRELYPHLTMKRPAQSRAGQFCSGRRPIGRCRRIIPVDGLATLTTLMLQTGQRSYIKGSSTSGWIEDRCQNRSPRQSRGGRRVPTSAPLCRPYRAA